MVEIIKNKKWEFVSSDYSVYNEKLKEWLTVINDFITINDFIEEAPSYDDDDNSIFDVPF